MIGSAVDEETAIREAAKLRLSGAQTTGHGTTSSVRFSTLSLAAS